MNLQAAKLLALIYESVVLGKRDVILSVQVKNNGRRRAATPVEKQKQLALKRGKKLYEQQ